jgi:hypothetical protein
MNLNIMEMYDKVEKKNVTVKDNMHTMVREGARVDLLDLLDKRTFLPKRKDGESVPPHRCVTLLDVMDLPSKVEPKKSKDDIVFPGNRTPLSRKDGTNTTERRHCVTVMDIMDDPTKSEPPHDTKKEKNINLLDLLDEKTRLPRDIVRTEIREIDRLSVLRARRQWAEV